MATEYDVQCPYCGQWQDICHDDGYGYEEDTDHHQECDLCGKRFRYRTSICFMYKAYPVEEGNDG